MPSYKLIYFANKGLAEPIRFLLSYAKVDFVDQRISEDEWLKLKPQMPFGNVPVLEVDGKLICQSTAICRYLAKRFGLAGEDDWEAVEIDAAVDTIHDVRHKVNDVFYEKNPASRAEKLAVSRAKAAFYIDRMDERAKRSTNDGYLVLGKLTWADVFFAATIDTLSQRGGWDLIESAENLKALRDKVLSLPGIKEYVEKNW